jgi:hypothetical protein
VVLVKIDPSRVGRDLLYLQSFDVTIETGAASWFADIGPATAEPRSGFATPPGTPRIELREIPPTSPPTRRGIRVPTAPRPAGAPPARRCVADSSGELACY